MYYYVNYYSVLFLLFCVVTHCDELPEGSECESEDGMKGTCIDIHKCMQYVMPLKTRQKYPQLCSFNGQIPVVCCTDCEYVNDTRNVLVDSFGSHYFKVGNKAYDKCMEYVIDAPFSCRLWGGVQRYLVEEQSCYGYTPTVSLAAAGGFDAGRGQYPHMALLGYGEDTESADWLCGGTLISHRYVLTAAHCLSSRALGPVKYIALGLLKRSDPRDTWQIYNVQASIPHPEYQPPSKYHDIALLVTDKWVPFSPEVLPACLTAGRVQEQAFATGWGATGHREALADTLQTVTLTAYTEEECMGFFPPHRQLQNGYDHSTQMCYGAKDQINDTCEGDSGGPLQVPSVLSPCVHTIIGVTSHGKPCGFVGGSGVYTRVEYYVPWIEGIVWP